jgi:hypothetical protein
VQNSSEPTSHHNGDGKAGGNTDGGEQGLNHSQTTGDDVTAKQLTDGRTKGKPGNQQVWFF